jgi:ATP/maltotriose-dependent transcriptional regulator MalT
MGLDEVVAYALDRRPAPAPLTGREREAAGLAGAGLSNRDMTYAPSNGSTTSPNRRNVET